MFEKYKIVTDSTTSLTKEECEKLDIVCLETSYTLDSELHSAFDDDSVSLPDFYLNLEKVKSCSTGCVNTDTFETCFNELTSQGYKVIYLGLSASLSSTFSNAEIAKNNVNEKYDEQVVAVIDTRCASYGALILIERVQELINENKSIKEIENIVTEDAKNMSVAFVSPDISFMYKCGRLGAIEMRIGKLLRIVPIIHVSESGKLKVKDKCIGKKLALKKVKNEFVQFINEKHHKKCYLSSCAMEDEVEEIKEYIASNTDIKIEDMKSGLIDKTLSCCCGPKTVAIFCL